jgi:hypothetical protein
MCIYIRIGDGFLPIGGPEDTLKTVYGQYSNNGGKKNSEIMSSDQLRCKIKILSKNNIDRYLSVHVSI